MLLSGLSSVTLTVMINSNTRARVRVLRLSILTATPSMRARVYAYIILRPCVRLRGYYNKGGGYNYGEYDSMPRMPQGLQDRERA